VLSCDGTPTVQLEELELCDPVERDAELFEPELFDAEVEVDPELVVFPDPEVECEPEASDDDVDALVEVPEDPHPATARQSTHEDK